MSQSAHMATDRRVCVYDLRLEALVPIRAFAAPVACRFIIGESECICLILAPYANQDAMADGARTPPK